ncbi:MAG: hemerythrin domain-containing protein [Betaproteobacteria bacterium]
MTRLKVSLRQEAYLRRMELWDTPAGFDEPLAALSACHRRIEKQLATLTRLQKHLALHVCDHDALTAAAGILRYFREAAPNHHADEETDLFPRVLRAAQATADHARAFELVSRLLVEHRDMERHWDRVREGLEALKQDEIGSLELDLCRDFARAYASHIEREDKLLLPLAGRVLATEALQAVGNAMARRRGLPTPFAAA